MRANIIVGLCALAMGIVAAAAIGAVASRTLMKPAPEARFTTLSGETFSTAELRGKVVLVNFWGTYCGTCLKEMPKLVDAHRKFAPRGYETVAIAVRHDNAERVAGFAASRALPFQIAFDRSGELAKDFGNVRITPTSFLIDRRGRVIWRAVGEPNWSELHERVERALGDSGS
jgi:peroxiredoxin